MLFCTLHVSLKYHVEDINSANLPSFTSVLPGNSSLLTCWTRDRSRGAKFNSPAGICE